MDLVSPLMVCFVPSPFRTPSKSHAQRSAVLQASLVDQCSQYVPSERATKTWHHGGFAHWPVPPPGALWARDNMEGSL